MEILLVEDSEEVALITQEFLEELGHKPVAVTSAELAIERLAGQKFDAVMTDVRLPGISGIALAKELMKSHPTLPVVISSGYGVLDLKTLVGAGVRSVFVLPKPYDLDTLDKTLKDAASYSQG